jgi:hypothetical protein
MDTERANETLPSLPSPRVPHDHGPLSPPQFSHEASTPDPLSSPPRGEGHLPPFMYACVDNGFALPIRRSSLVRKLTRLWPSAFVIGLSLLVGTPALATKSLELSTLPS